MILHTDWIETTRSWFTAPPLSVSYAHAKRPCWYAQNKGLEIWRIRETEYCIQVATQSSAKIDHDNKHALHSCDFIAHTTCWNGLYSGCNLNTCNQRIWDRIQCMQSLNAGHEDTASPWSQAKARCVMSCDTSIQGLRQLPLNQLPWEQVCTKSMVQVDTERRYSIPQLAFVVQLQPIEFAKYSLGICKLLLSLLLSLPQE